MSVSPTVGGHATSATFRWQMRAFGSVIPMWWWKKMKVWRWMNPQTPGSCAVLLEKGFLEGPKAEADEDRHSHTTEESMDQNPPPPDSDLDEDELLGPPADVSVPGGHSDDSVALVVSPGDDDL